MSGIIHLLPDHVANQIAAGEVIQRPASVVKELLDNAIDAGAQTITLIVEEAGKALIQVIDDGKGMNPDDARMCWERHATSKLKTIDDIYAIQTMGFRGEALASIASVASVELKTCQQQTHPGTRIIMEGSKCMVNEPCASPKGTSIAVKNLFFNVPARRQFLKSNPVELKHIVEEFTRAALSMPHISFRMLHNNDESFRWDAADLEKRIADVFPEKEKKNLLAFTENTSLVNLSGFIGSPAIAKKNRGEQYFFVNNRFIRDAYLNHAVNGAFEQSIPENNYPFYVIFLDVDPASIDVNIHPTKTEIKFSEEKNIYQILRAVVRKTLGEHHCIPDIQGFDDNQFMQRELNKDFLNNHTIHSSHAMQTQQSWTNNTHRSNHSQNSDWKQLYEITRIEKQQKQELFAQPLPTPSKENNIPAEELLSRNFMQLHLQYIVTQVKSATLIIEQSKAHERILYEKILHSYADQQPAIQQKLFPVSVFLNASDIALMEELIPELRNIGFDIQSFGKNTFVINGVPAGMEHIREQSFLDELLEQYKNGHQTWSKHEHIARTIARQASVKKGSRLSNEEMAAMVDELFACSNPSIAPDGSPCVHMLPWDEIQKWFLKK